jgi:subtilase family serine protease
MRISNHRVAGSSRANRIRAIAKTLLTGGVSALLLSAVVGAGSGAPPKTDVSSSAQLVRLAGKVHRLAQPRYDIGEAPSSLKMGGLKLVLAKTSAQQVALEQLIAAQQDPKSPQYHHFLNPAEYGARFGASDAAIAAVTQWLQQIGFKVRPVAASRSQLYFVGTKAQVESAFHTEIHVFDVNGERHYANVSVPEVPAGVAPLISSVQGLHDFYPKPTLQERPPSKTGSPNVTYTNGSHLVGPGDFAVIYNMNPLYNAGINGANETIAIGAASDLNPAIANAYWQAFGITPPQLQSIPVPGGQDPGLTHTGAEDEVYLDVEVAGGLAPGAEILVVRDKNVFEAVNYAIQQDLAAVVNISFDACEANQDNSDVDMLFQQASTQGITVTVSSGDGGVADCFANRFTQGDLSTSGFAVNGNASSPHALAVGGTEFDPTMSQDWSSGSAPGTLVSALAHIPEMVWNNSCADPEIAQSDGAADPTTFCNTSTYQGQPNPNIVVATAGGGLSSCIDQDKNGNCTAGWPQPSWQAGINGTQGFTTRAVPDVVLLADSWITCSYSQSTCDPTNGADFAVAQGTSAAAPAMAAIIALLDQAQSTRQGLANPALYALAAAEYGTSQSRNSSAANCSASLGQSIGSACVFYDVTAGSNATGCDVANYQATGSSPASTCSASSGDANGIMAVSGAVQYSAATGYDLASGLGSINAAGLVLALGLPAPTGLAATTGGQSIGLKWTAEPQAASFNVYQGSQSGNEDPTPVVTGATGTSASVGSLSYGQTYYFTIAAVSSLGTSARSNEASVTTLAAVPTGLTASAGNGSVSLSWTASTGAATYNVYQGVASGGEGTTAVQTGVSTTSASITGLTNGTTYYFTVAAVDSGGTSAQSAEAHAAPVAPPSGGGGGAIGWLELGLLGFVAARRSLRSSLLPLRRSPWVPHVPRRCTTAGIPRSR